MGTPKQARRWASMFVRDHLAVVSHWARDQLRHDAETADKAVLLQQLIEAADALRAELTPAAPPNVVSLNAFRHVAH